MRVISVKFLITLAVGCLSLASLPLTDAWALEDSQIIPGAKRINHVSSGALKGACDRSGGSYFETPDEYLCAGDSGWVYCEKKSGDCVGGTGDGKEQKKRARYRAPMAVPALKLIPLR